jgi:hypothetical protein
MVVVCSKITIGQDKKMKLFAAVLSVLALAACVTPDVQMRSGVGFQDYSVYQQQQAFLARSRAVERQAQVQAQVREQQAQVQPAAPVTTAPATTTVASAQPAFTVPVRETAAVPTASQTIGTETLAALGAETAQPVTPTTAGAPLSALSAAAMGTQAPASAPLAPVSASGSNIVAFALSTNHGIGQQMYRRSGNISAARLARICRGFASDGLAQEAFLARGGPERDTLGLDPDGDGYACSWDPSPFRAIQG